MKKYTFKRQLLFVVFMLLGCLAIHAADDDLITKQITVKLDEAGTLPDKISDSKKYKITNLKIVGDVNGTDVNFIREMAGINADVNPTKGKLAILDLADAKIVEGGRYYLWVVGEVLYTKKDIVGKRLFEKCSNLTSVILPSGVTSIEEDAFVQCSSLTSVVIPSSVKVIGMSAFRDCSNLRSVEIPSSVTIIGSEAFWNCSNLRSVEIPSGVKSIYGSTFNGCSSLTRVDIPSSVTSIEYGAFSGCSSLTSVVIPSNAWIGEYAFSGCSSLTSIDIHLGAIRAGTFSGCSGLTSVVIPLGVTSIGEYAFSGCSGLTSIDIPSSVTDIGKAAFKDCSSLTSVYVSSDSPASIGIGAFSGIDKTACTLYVPQGTKDDYWLSSWGDDFDNIEEYDVTGIDQVADGDDVKEVSRYSVDGKRLDAPAKGLNIVKYSDGSVKKIAVQ